MEKKIFTYIIGGKAGEGIKKAGSAASNLFTDMGRNVFELEDYQSLIRGGHNFSVVSTAIEDINSHYMKADLVVNLDERSYKNHQEQVSDDGIVIYNSDEMDEGKGIGLPLTSEAKEYSRPDLILGVSGIAILSAVLGMDKEDMKNFVEKEYSKGVDDNLSYAEKIYDMAVEKDIHNKFELENGEEKRKVLTGNEAISLGTTSAGLDIYIAYPMTPASSILHYFAAHKDDLQVMPVHPESEIAVANLAVGATLPGARTMVGTSGGGFALMGEAFSLAGMAEAPVLFVLSSRPGPSTGVPTYTEQGDLNFALHQGHGEFPRIVAAPGTIEESFYLSAEMLNLVWEFQTPGILLTEKHLSESSMTVELDSEHTEWTEPIMHESGDYDRYKDTDDGISPLKFPPSEDVIKWNSKEHDEYGISTEEPNIVTKMHDKRRKKGDSIVKKMKDMETVNEYGSGDTVIFTYGSTTMSVLEAVKHGDLDVKIVQPKYLEPLPIWELEEYMGKDVIVVEQSSEGQFAKLLRDKVNIVPKTVIRRYDGRPFEPEQLAEELKEVI
ncbi:MAG: 2-oxoacid:acceptor oxidoreductase subunit alpha [Thermoplasmata archaeon]